MDGFLADGNIRWRRFGWYRHRPRLKSTSLNRHYFAERQPRARPTEPGDVDAGMVPGGLTRQQIAPKLDRGLGLLDILKKGEFAVITTPAAGLEQFREVVESLLGKSTPAADNIATARHVQSICHKPAREEKPDADATGTNQFDATGIFCGKLLFCPVSAPHRSPIIERKPRKGRAVLGIGGQARDRGWLSCDRRKRVGAAIRSISLNGNARNISPNERPVRGDNRTGQAIWALGVDGRSRRIQPRWGGIAAPTDIGRSRVGARSIRPRFF
jgi:hypothetical protein